MRKQLIIETREQIAEYRRKIMDVTNTKVKGVLQNLEGIELLRTIKFDQSGYDPLFDEPLNFIEAVNQTFTYLTCLNGTEILMTKHPEHCFTVNFGTESGYDIISEDESIIAECFAVTTPDSNSKLDKDTSKVDKNTSAEKKYVIFYASNPKPIHVSNVMKKYPDVEIIALDTI